MAAIIDTTQGNGLYLWQAKAKAHDWVIDPAASHIRT